MADPTQAQTTTYRVYETDEAKAKAYNIRLAAGDQQYKDYAEWAEAWYDRYENKPLPTQTTAKGHRVETTTGVSVIDALFSGLTAIDVEYVIEALGKASADQAVLAEVALNQEWGVTHADDERDSTLKDALIVGIGFVKVAYDYFSTEELVARSLQDIEADVIHLLDEAKAAGVEAPDAETIAKLVPDDETQETVHRDRICVDYVPYTDIRWDPAAKRWKDVRWVAQYTRMPTTEIKANPVWRAYCKQRGNLKKLGDVSGDVVNGRQLEVKPTEYDRAEERATVVEMHDLVTGTICTYVKGQTWLLNESVNPRALFPDFPERSMFVPLVLRATNRRVRGISDVEVMMTSLREKDLYRTKTAEYIDKFVPKMIGPEDALTSEGQVAMESNQFGAYISTATGTDGNAVRDVKPPPLPSEMFDMNDRLDNEIREATGVNELMRGLFPDRKRTATETSEVVSASAARQSEKRNTLESFHVEVAKRILHLMQQFYTSDRIVRMLDPNYGGSTAWEWTGDDIMEDFDLKVHLSPREDDSRDSMKQEALDFMSVFGPFFQPGPDGSTVLDPHQSVMWAMKKYGLSYRDIVELTQTPQDQQVQQADSLAAQANQAQAQQGVPPGALPANPLEQPSQTPVPQDVLAAAVGGFGPGAPQAAETVSNSRGIQ